jgi:uncharacterized protein YggE
MRKKFFASTFALALSLGLIGTGLSPAHAASPQRYISVSGVGTVSVVPDAVRYFAAVSTVGKSNKEALASTSVVVSKVRKALLDNAVAKKDIKTSALTVYPEYSYSQERGSEIIGYRASQSFSVVVRKAEKAGEIIDATVEAAGDLLQVNGISPFLINGASATQEARAAAVADAKARANSYAKLLGLKLGKVVYLIEASAPSYSFPMPIADKVSSENATEIDLGEQEVSVSVTVRWSLN